MRNKMSLVSLSLFTVSVFASEQVADHVAPEFTSQIVSKQAVSANKYILTAANPVAVSAGAKVLKRGGTAADAAVVVQTVLGLVEPQSSGLGGGGFLVYYDAASQSLTTYDGRETAPLAATPSLFQDANGQPVKFFDAVVGGRSVATPATVKLLATIHRKYGKQSWSELHQPAIALAQQGFIVSERLASAIARDEARLKRYPDTQAYFFTPDGNPVAQGERLTNLEYAVTLEQIAKYGDAAFYQGQIATDIVNKVTNITDNPGVLSKDDFSIYRVVERDPVCAPYREYQICGMGPPSSGALTVGQILGMVSHFDLSALGANSPVAWQIIGDASRLAFADRGRYIADTDYVPMPEGLLDADYLAKRAAFITKGQALSSVSPGEPRWSQEIALADDDSIELPSTTHMVIVDQYGNIVSMTSTIENGFGSRVMSNGFLLNNQLTDFSFVSHAQGYPIANRVEPGKRPRSSMAPTIVMKDGKPYMAIGSPGGSQIIGYVVKALIAHIDWGMDIQQAIELPNMVNRFGTFDLEAGTEAEQMQQPLQAMGFEVQVRDLNSGLHGVVFGDNIMLGGADSRREGIVLGE